MNKTKSYRYNKKVLNLKKTKNFIKRILEKLYNNAKCLKKYNKLHDKPKFVMYDDMDEFDLETDDDDEEYLL